MESLVPILVNPVVGKVNVARLAAPLKASFPIEVIPSGKVIVLKLAQLWNKLLEIEVKVFGKVTMAKLPAFKKTSLQMC